jgi:hypothetical protein
VHRGAGGGGGSVELGQALGHLHQALLVLPVLHLPAAPHRMVRTRGLRVCAEECRFIHGVIDRRRSVRVGVGPGYNDDIARAWQSIDDTAGAGHLCFAISVGIKRQ